MLEYSSSLKKASISEYSFLSCLNQLQLLGGGEVSEMTFLKNNFYSHLKTSAGRNNNILEDFAMGQGEIFDLRQVLIVLYFLSSSTVEEKAKHICQLFSHMPSATVSTKIQPQATLRSSREIVVIIGTLVEVSLVTLPNYAGEVSLRNF